MNYLFTPIAHAASDNVPAPLKKYVGKFVDIIVNPAIVLLFAAALVVFLYGVVELLLSGSPEKKETGKQHILWGIIGMTIMLGVFAIVRILGGTVGNSNPI